MTTCGPRGIHRCLAVVAAILLMASPAAGQDVPIAGAQRASRSELMALATSLDAELASGALRGKKLENVKARLTAVRTRLERGDFHVGDRFIVTIRQDSVRNDTASVRDSMVVSVAALPELSVAGVLRSELDDRLNTHIAKYFRNATVRSQVLTRVTILGAVRSPGFYYASPDRPLGELVMVAGGPAPDANLKKMTVRRSGNTILEGKASQEALEQGKTLEQTDVQSGDEIQVAAIRRVNWGAFMRVGLLAFTALIGFMQFLQWYYTRQDA